MSTDKQTVDRIMALKGDADRVKTEVARLEATQEAAEQRLAEVRQQLVDLGLDPDGDLTSELAERQRGLEQEMGALQQDLVALRQEAAA